MVAYVTPLERDLLQRLEAVVAQVDDLLGPDLFDPHRETVEDRVFDRARTYADQLEDPDPAVARQAAVAVGDLVNTRDPADAGTPLGVAVASTDGFEGQLLSQKEAADLLRVTRQRVNDLARPSTTPGHRPRLEKVGTRITRTSVARELARRAARPLHVVERIDERGQGQGRYLTDIGTWTPAAAGARTFRTLKEARHVANRGPGGVLARGITVRSKEGID